MKKVKKEGELSQILKSFKGTVGYKKDFKKAIVTLAEGNTIDSSLEIK